MTRRRVMEALFHRLVVDFAQITQRLADPVQALAEESRLRAVLAQLSPQDQELLTLVAWEELSTGEIAIALGIRPAAVRLRLHRARRRLQAALGQDSDMKQDASRGQVTDHREDTTRSRLAEGAS